MKVNFDYVIVGAGSAGCVLAARLSEDPDVTVALVEAGGRDIGPGTGLSIDGSGWREADFDRDLMSEPEPALRQRRIDLRKGGGLGGSSISGLAYIRGNRADFDEWSRHGAAGWSYDEILPYFIKSEANEFRGDDLHGRNGPPNVSNSRSMHRLVDRFVEAGIAAGLARNDDFNGQSQFGVGRYQFMRRDGSAARAYLHLASKRSNLRVFTNARVRKIEFDGRHARRILAHRDGKELTLLADREIVLSAGAYGTPHILMLSGIGQPEQLGPLGIDPIVNLPVGENLQDHPLVLLSYLADRETLPAVGDRYVGLFNEEQHGPVAGAFIASRAGLDAPDIEIAMRPGLSLDEGLSFDERPTASCDHCYSFASSVMKPTSRGKVMLGSARPDVKPRIVCNLLTTPEDKEVMIAAVRTCLQIVGQPSLRAIQRKVQNAPLSDRDHDIWSYVQQNAGLACQPTSTCSIGTVVDCLLNVQGVHGLRVVDASVMPSIVRGRTNATVIAIAERAADIMTGRVSRRLREPPHAYRPLRIVNARHAVSVVRGVAAARSA
jgi:choline dehydrogenase-like flavoprotein